MNIVVDARSAYDDQQAEKGGALTEDEHERQKEKVQALLKSYEGKIDELAVKKEKEVTEG